MQNERLIKSAELRRQAVGLFCIKSFRVDWISSTLFKGEYLDDGSHVLLYTSLFKGELVWRCLRLLFMGFTEVGVNELIKGSTDVHTCSHVIVHESGDSRGGEGG